MDILIGIATGLGVIGVIALLTRKGYLKGFKNFFGGTKYLLGYPRGIRNNNPGNIELTQSLWEGEIPHQQNTDGRFKQFYEYAYGIRAAIVNLKSYYNKGYRTIRQIISKWAPPNENDTEKYIRHVAKSTGITENTVITFDKQTIKKLVGAIIMRENGRLYMTDKDFENAWNLAARHT